MGTTTGSSFDERVQEVLAEFGAVGLIDRFAANDLLLDLLDVAGTEAEHTRIMEALTALPKSSLVDRAELAAVLTGLCTNKPAAGWPVCPPPS